GLDFDELGINEVVDLLDNTNMEAVVRDFGDRNQKEDPVMHFFEGFLQEYDSKIRKDRGVFYTPQPVVSFIVSSVDEQLRMEFGLEDGLADTTTWGELAKRTANVAIPEGISPDQAFVQILDPATGTGTFPVEVIDLIYKTMIAKWQSHGNSEAKIKELWNEYVPKHLLPRLHGYELMMAPYAIAHMKIGLKLYETGYGFKSDERARIYLTNALQPADDFFNTFSFIIPTLASEVQAVNDVKFRHKFTVLIGNPPYLREAGPAKGWIGELMTAYKMEPGGKVKLNERNPKNLNDLYVQFIRLFSWLVEESGCGVIGLISNNGYLNNPTFRGMRWHILKTFQRIYVLDLHGNSKKKEVTPEGKPDQNVFDIQQGVSILVASKTNKKIDGLCEVEHKDLWGERQDKYQTLSAGNLSSFDLEIVQSPEPQYSFVKQDFEVFEKYKKGFSIKSFMPINSIGIVTARDELTIDSNIDVLWQRVLDFSASEPEEARERYKLGNDVSEWKVVWAQDDLKQNLSKENIVQITYRPLDIRWTYYTGNSRGFMGRPRSSVMKHMIQLDNIAIATGRSNKNPDVDHFYVVNNLMETKCAESSTGSNIFPLYLTDPKVKIEKNPIINFEPILFKKLQDLATSPEHGMPNEIEVFDYIYGILYCPAYRKTYADFLKIDFPFIPWPSNPNEFWSISSKGTQLRGLHLMNLDSIGQTGYPLIGEGSNTVSKPKFLDDKVWINESQYFNQVPKVSWEFSIGGYQPAQKWLKYRKGSS
ncbi:DNA methyltransferase, partial [Alphaproteobacteria bacterium]|nr:DNA methyltransferase [Alphaproteobacteria bacterium]